MTPSQMIELMRCIGRSDALINFRLLADNVPGARLKDGRRLANILDFSAWLRELGEEAARTEVSLSAERSTGLKVTPRLELRLEQEPVCHGCGHVHEGEYECGKDMGGAGKCGCRMEVRV